MCGGVGRVVWVGCVVMWVGWCVCGMVWVGYVWLLCVCTPIFINANVLYCLLQCYYLCKNQKKLNVYLTTRSTHCIYSYLASDIL